MRSNPFVPAVCTLAAVCCLASAGLAYTGANISVYDIDSSDVPGPQPIRVFPVPAAAGWTDATLIYDNYSEGLPFSAGINYADLSWVDLPLGNADVTINGLDYLPGVSNVTVDNSFQLLTNEEGDFSGDGIVDGADYTLWAEYYTGAPDVPGPPVLLPEPAALGLLAAGMVGLLRRRRG